MKAIFSLMITVCAAVWLINLYQIYVNVPGSLKYLNVVLLPLVVIYLIYQSTNRE